MVGVVLAAAAIILISFGFNNLNRWGLGLAGPNAPFNVLGLSPAPIMIVVGIVLGQAFLMWTHRRQAAGKTPLLALEVIDSPQERAAVYAMFSVVALEATLNFSVPLYIQIVQGRSPLATAIAMMPFNLTVFFAAMLIVRFYDKLTPRQIGRYRLHPLHARAAVARLRRAQRLERGPRAVRPRPVRHRAGIAGHAAVQRAGHRLAQGARGRRRRRCAAPRNNLAAAVGTAVAGALLVGLLSAIVLRSIAENPMLPPEIQSQVDLDNINFVSNDRLREVMQRTTATPEQVEEAVRVNTEARLRALKIGLLIMAGLALVTIIPAGRLPNYVPGEVPDDQPPSRAQRDKA